MSLGKRGPSDRAALETYFGEMRDIHSTGAAVKETSYYGALSNLLTTLGATLKPKVRCVINIQNRGAGIPDGGLFTANQFQKGEHEPPPGQLPERGAIEIKAPSDDAWVTANSKQVTGYWKRYGLVLVTNYRDFVLVGRDQSGSPVKLETYRIAKNAAEFWSLVRNPKKAADEHGERLTEYLKRVLLTNAPLISPEDVAWFLASYARDANARIAHVDLPALAAIRSALEDALGLKFHGEKGEHFFRSTLVQTLFYGIFSAWVLWSKQNATGKFDWKQAAWSLHVPMIKALFDQIATPTKLQPLGLVEPLEWAANALNRVDRNAFFKSFDEGHAVQYFYEPFLEQFDPELRKDLGVWYTPPEIVKYMVARVDTVLREELDIEDGLADPRVYVLDPCCGTGAFLVEVIQHIAETLRVNGGDALVAQDLKHAAMTRVFGFEIMPAPFVVAHLQMGLYLQNLRVPLEHESSERAAIYLTNALTGWEPPKGVKQTFPYLPEMQEERDAAEKIKRERPIIVILGNPPYNGYAGAAMDEERELTAAYRKTKKAPVPQGQGLNDLYIRFFRVAERKIAGETKQGVVCFISNYSWLDGLSFTGMREQYLDAFEKIWIDNLHGDRIISEYSPDGRTSETIFALQGQSPGIKIGTAIGLMACRTKGEGQQADIRYRDFDNARAAERRNSLLASLKESNEKSGYRLIEPIAELGLPFRPKAISTQYLSWPLLPELFPTSFPGVKTSRDSFLVDIDREKLTRRIEDYFDRSISHHELRQKYPEVMENSARYHSETIRDYLLNRGILKDNVVRFAYRPFDTRWLYWEPEAKLLDEKRSDYWPHVVDGNLWLEARQKQPMDKFDRGYVTTHIADNFGNGLSNFFPLHLIKGGQISMFESGKSDYIPNIAEKMRMFLDRMKLPPKESSRCGFFHAIAILHSPAFRTENEGALRQDWPRVPLPNTRKRLETSSEIGQQIAALLDSESSIKGITSGALRQELKAIAAITRQGGGSIDPKKGELDLTAGWGHSGKGGVTMPGKGMMTARDYTEEERDAIDSGVTGLGLDSEQAFKLLGATTCDVYLNGIAHWRCVPRKVWEYTIGGYQVIKKWLSYREKSLLGRGLTQEEAREVTNIARRITAILLLQPALDANYQAVVSDTYQWPR